MTGAEISKADLPVMFFKHKAAWETWLRKRYGTSTGLWLRLAKKAAKRRSVTYEEALEVALCYGWIDGQKKSYDGESWLQRFTPRKPKSIWSKINQAKALRLMKQGRMQAAGLAAIESAKRDGRWDAAYDSHRTAVPTHDFQTALNDNPKAKAFFAALNSQNKYAILFRIQTAKEIDTRRKRIEQCVRMLAKHDKLYP